MKAGVIRFPTPPAGKARLAAAGASLEPWQQEFALLLGCLQTMSLSQLRIAGIVCRAIVIGGAGHAS